MIIRFDEMEEKVTHRMKDGQGDFHHKMLIDGQNKILQGRLEPGCSIGLHTHEGNSEIIYVLSGEGKAIYDDGEERVSAGTCHYCPMGHAHSLVNDGTQPLCFFAVIPTHGA